MDREWMGLETTGLGFYPGRLRVIRGKKFLS
jgi:hypothetical protein